MNKVIYPLCPCPWCKQLPALKFYFVLGTWLPEIVCENRFCSVNPKSKPQVIRKTCKTDPSRMRIKISALFESWNSNNPIQATQGKVIDYNFVIKEGEKSEEFRKKK